VENQDLNFWIQFFELNSDYQHQLWLEETPTELYKNGHNWLIHILHH
jgi:hypothetical protein